MPEDTQRDDPPRVPEIDRRVELGAGRTLGVILLMLLPALAILGVLDDARAVSETSSASLTVRVDHPQRMRSDSEGELRVTVTRTAGAAAPVRLRFENAYLDPFVLLGAEPAGDAAGELMLEELSTGETREARLQIRARRMSVARGALHVEAPGEALRLELRTRILP